VRWEKVNTSNGYFYLKNVETGKYFRPANGDDNSKLELRPTSYSGSFTQWKQVTSSGGYFYLQNRATGKYFRPTSTDDIGPTTGTNFDMQQKSTTWNGPWTQWKFENVTGSKSISDVDDIETTNSMKIYPNPVVDNLNIQLNDLDGEANISLMDMQGRIVKSEVSSDTQMTINAEGLSGIFILKVETQNRTFVEKIVVQ